jgi:1-acyl-sn-glycerol-3-phosphate acyltransferase
MHAADRPNQFSLLRQRRFAPFFWTQFLGAGNDNLFKFAFTVMVTYQLQVAWLPPAMAGLVIGALFILPFVLFSATSGQLADKLEKTRVIRFVKNLEIAIMAVAGLGFMTQNAVLLLVCVAAMGLHSTLFGPVKFAYLPQHLSPRELTGGNGMVEMGTFVAILLGNLAGGLLIAIPGVGATWVAVACFAAALLGRWAAQGVPLSPATDPSLAINWNPFTETWRNLKLARENAVVFRSLLGISWMWFFGAVFLANFPSFAKEVLHGDEQVASLLLVVFSVGIGVGALLCEAVSRRQVEIGLVPLGAIGMSVFAVDLYFASRGLPASGLQTVGSFIAQPAHWRVMVDLGALALFTGLYSVPMYALIQLRCQPSHRARIIAANNILNALFMIVSSLGAGAMLGAGFTLPEVFLATGLLNAVVGIYIFWRVPEYLLRFVAFGLSRGLYRLRVVGDEHLPANGAALVVCNRVSVLDALLLMAASPRPMRFMIDQHLIQRPLLGGLFRLAQVIPVAFQTSDPAADHTTNQAALDAADAVLAAGDLLCIFPEGSMPGDGRLQPFQSGLMKILHRRPVPVVPMALQILGGPSGSPIGQGAARVGPLRRNAFSPVGLVVGPAMPPQGITAAGLQQQVQQLLDSAPLGAAAGQALRPPVR